MRNLEIRTHKKFKIDVEEETLAAEKWCFCDQTRTVYFVSGQKVWKQCLEDDGQSRQLLTEWVKTHFIFYFENVKKYLPTRLGNNTNPVDKFLCFPNFES